MPRLFSPSLLLLLAFLLLLVSTVRAGIADLAYPSALLKQDVPIKVYTPPGYEAAAAAGTRYPVVYNFHGGGGTPARQWDRTRATLTDAMEQRRARPMIYVFVNGLGNTEFVNTAAGQPIERSIVEELVPFIDARYRTIASRAGRAVDGFSMGGFGCLSVAMRNPDLFCAAVGYGAALSITAAGKNYRAPAHFAEHDPHALIRAKTDLIRDEVRLRLVCGDADWLYPANVAFKQLLDELRVPVDWVVVPGVAHNTMGLYEACGLESLHWLEDSFDQAASGNPMHATVGRPRAAPALVGGVALGDEPAPFRPSGPLPRLRVHAGGHHFATVDGRPFFLLADTAWLLCQNLDREGIDKYLEDRASRDFAAVLAHIPPWQPGDKNAYGETAFADGDWSRPNENYWAHIDHIVREAAAKGLYLGLLPLWARNYVNLGNRNAGPPRLDPAQARAYGRFLGARYGARPHVFWVLGGDAAPGGHEAHFDALAAGLREGTGAHAGDLLLTYHPNGTPNSSATWFHDRPWLSFNLIQSTHKVWKLNYAEIARDYALRPAKPILEGEPPYENHPIDHKPENGHFNAWHVRVKAYWSVFAGGAGFVYGGNGVWQMDRAGHPPHRASHFTQNWEDALALPGAAQMRHLRRLVESRPFFSRVPDDGTVLASPAGTEADRIQVTRGADRTWAMYYLTTGQNVKVSPTNLVGPVLHAWWFDPRTGKTCDAIGQPSAKPFAQLDLAAKNAEFDPPGAPGEGNDWILVLDTASKNYPAPGTRP